MTKEQTTNLRSRGIALFILIMFNLSLAQSQRWLYQYDGPAQNYDCATAIVYGLDGNIYVAGYGIGNNANYDIVVICLTTMGNQQWVYTYNGPGNGDDYAYSLVYGADHNLYLCGKCTSTNNNFDFTVISLTNNGTQRWVYHYNGAANSNDNASSIVYGTDNNLYVAGSSRESNSYSDILLISLTTTGIQRWIYTYDGSIHRDDFANALVYGLDGNLYLAGASTATNYYLDFMVISITNNGTQRWVQQFDGYAYNIDIAYAIVYSQDHLIYAAGKSYNTASNSSFMVICYTPNGQFRWLTGFGGAGGHYNYATAIVYGPDHYLYSTGTITNTGNQVDLYLMSLDSVGYIRWMHSYNGSANATDEGKAICYGLDNYLYVAGYSIGTNTNKDWIIISLTPNGTRRWVYRYDGLVNYSDEAYAIVYGQDNNLYIAGYTYNSLTNANLLVISLDPRLSIQEPLNTEKKQDEKIQLKPNPTKNLLTLSSPVNIDEIILYNTNGQIVKAIHLSKHNPNHKLTIPLNSIPNGIYFIKINDHMLNDRLIKIK
ncbi:MAG: T9SS type A sorting domain-containing protein [candidate division WOR-3 bacterium]